MNKVLQLIQTEFVFLQYSISSKCPNHCIKQSIHNICINIEKLDKQSLEYKTYKNYLFSLIFYIRDGYFNGLKKPYESYTVLLEVFKFYPKEILNIIELYIY